MFLATSLDSFSLITAITTDPPFCLPRCDMPRELDFFVISSACASVPQWQAPRQLDPHLAEPGWMTYTLRRRRLAEGFKEGWGWPAGRSAETSP